MISMNYPYRGGIFMKKIKEQLTLPFNDLSVFIPESASSILFLDIETTGFHPKTTQLYLIGCLFYQENHWHLQQWFAESPEEEPLLLQEFLDFSEKFSIFLHYNGSSFDIPYFLKKCEFYHLSNHLSSKKQFDLFQKIFPYQKFLKLKNMKQKTIEQFLNIQREDPFSGSDLIPLYEQYKKDVAPTSKLLSVFLAHNKDDLCGLYQICPILSYPALFEKDFQIEDITFTKDAYLFSLSLQIPIPKRISFGKKYVYLSAFLNKATLQVECYQNELKFFYPNYKEYYYLPKEDMAIHQSVAFYVDRNFRTRAKAANCYSKKTGVFLPQFQPLLKPYFKIDFHDTLSYIEATPAFLQDQEKCKQYLYHLFYYLRK